MPSEDDNEHGYADGVDSGDDADEECDALEAAILTALNGDVHLAVMLIPVLYQQWRNTARSRVQRWQTTVTSPVDNSEEDSKSHSEAHGRSQVSGQAQDRQQSRRGTTPSSGRKRQRRANSDGADDEDDNEGDNNDSNYLGLPESAEALLLACPFHKYDPVKYGVQHDDSAFGRIDMYRTCIGPGFKTIQRLK